MPTVILDPMPAELEALLERRRQIGADRHDEVWEGVLHLAPAPHERQANLQWQLATILHPFALRAGLEGRGELNLGQPDDYRVPDGALRHPGPGGLYVDTVALAIEIVSPGDETWAKLPFYAAHHVDELLIVDPDAREVHWLALAEGEYGPTDHSDLIDLGPAELSARLTWPST